MVKNTSPVGTCSECGKLCFLSRKAAKSYLHRAHPDEKAMSIYSCGKYFHYGHTPYLVRRGINPR